MTNSIGIARSLQIGVSSAALLVGLASPAFAQTAPASAQDLPAPNASQSQSPSQVAIKDQNAQDTASTSSRDQAQSQTDGDVVVTGSLFRRSDSETPSPVTTLTAATLEQRGINTVTEAVQRLSANGAGTLPNSFSANGAFASGASAPSLRGLTTNSTLVLFDGLRAAYYPLADDGTRNFVDINSIPDAIVERIDVLKDGASSTYGADAVAGVVNIITKKQITGIRLNASAGISERGDTAEQRVDATVGYGDLEQNRFNFYVSGEYQKNAALYNRERGYPYNTADLSSLCGTSSAGVGVCRTNSIVNGIQYNGVYAGVGTTTVPVVRPYNATNTTALGRYQLLNPAAGCGLLNQVTLNAAQLASSTGASAAPVNCQQDLVRDYRVIAPEQQRIGGSARLTVKLNDTNQAYAAFNFYQSNVYYTGTPLAVTTSSPAGGVTYNGGTLALPVYVCAARVNCATAADRRLNPNNPFAAQGEVARLLYRFGDLPVSNQRLTNSYRGALGVNGTFGNDWSYTVEGVAMHEDLTATYKGYPYIQNLLNVIADGSYNFVDPTQNTAAIRNYIAPTVVNRSNSALYQVQGNVGKALFQLPGGPFQAAIGASWRRESIYAPSANPVIAGDLTGTQRYFSINGFGTSGSRDVSSGFFEVKAPLFDQLEIDGSGRYDSYSSGQHNFSPKVGAKFAPIRQVTFRGTWSRGFRIPSFAESYGLPTTGYVTQTPTAAFAALHGNDAYGTAQYSLGLTSTGNPNLRPEKSRSFTGGVIIEPVRNVSLSVDYYNIEKFDVITGANYAPAIAQYYANNGVVNLPGITVVPQTADPAFPNALPLLGFIQYSFLNANRLLSSGIDMDLEVSRTIGPVKWTSSLDAAYVIKLAQSFPDGTYQRYDGTLGPYQTTSASGTPKWRGSWQNTFDFGRFSITPTVYYTSGYNEGATDDGNTYNTSNSCALNADGSAGSYALYRDNTTIVTCRVKHFIDVDLSASVKVNDQFTLYANVLNLLDVSAPYDPSTYGGYQYNPAWANSGIIGRYFRVGARAKF